jgi:hypothetical protein
MLVYRLSNMLPPHAVDNGSNSPLGDVEAASKGSLCFPFCPSSTNFLYLLLGEFGRRNSFATADQAESYRMLLVLFIRDVFKIFGAIICFITVYMIDLQILGAGANKCCGDGTMNTKEPEITILANYNLRIALFIYMKLKQAARFPIANATQTTNFVIFKLRNRFPDFLRGSINVSHDLSLLNRLKLWSGSFGRCELSFEPFAF